MKLADFGLSRCDKTAVSSALGTDFFLAPEADDYSKSTLRETYSKRDIFSCGIVALKMISGDPCYMDSDGTQTIMNFNVHP